MCTLIAFFIVLVVLLLFWTFHKEQAEEALEMMQWKALKRQVAAAQEAQEAQKQQEAQKNLNDVVNIRVDRSVPPSPQPDVTACYWGSDYSQEAVDSINRLNMESVDIVTPLVMARTNPFPYACRCGADMMGKSVFD